MLKNKMLYAVAGLIFAGVGYKLYSRQTVTNDNSDNFTQGDTASVYSGGVAVSNAAPAVSNSSGVNESAKVAVLGTANDGILKTLLSKVGVGTGLDVVYNSSGQVTNVSRVARLDAQDVRAKTASTDTRVFAEKVRQNVLAARTATKAPNAAISTKVNAKNDSYLDTLVGAFKGSEKDRLNKIVSSDRVEKLKATQAAVKNSNYFKNLNVKAEIENKKAIVNTDNAVKLKAAPTAAQVVAPKVKQQKDFKLNVAKGTRELVNRGV